MKAVDLALCLTPNIWTTPVNTLFPTCTPQSARIGIYLMLAPSKGQEVGAQPLEMPWDGLTLPPQVTSSA